MLLKVTPTVYPHFNDLPGIKIFDFKVDPLNLKSQAKNIPVVIPSSPIKILDKLVNGFLNYDRTLKGSVCDKWKGGIGLMR